MPAEESRLSWAEEQHLKHMTLEACFIGSDGIVLASDQRRLDWGGGADWSALTPKIYIDPSGAFAWCGAGDQRVIDACERIFDSISAAPQAFAIPTIPLRKLCNDMAVYEGKRQLLFASAIEGMAWMGSMSSPVEVKEILNKWIIGDTGNTARYFPERYLPKEKTPVNKLLLLAAHTILMGSKCNPMLVEGLEIAVSAGGSFQRLTDSEISNLTLRSARLDESIRTQLFPS